MAGWMLVGLAAQWAALAGWWAYTGQWGFSLFGVGVVLQNLGLLWAMKG